MTGQQEETTLDGVREYAEGYKVVIRRLTAKDHEYDNTREIGRLVIKALNEGGYNSTEVDLIDLLRWVRQNHPEWYENLENL